MNTLYQSPVFRRAGSAIGDLQERTFYDRLHAEGASILSLRDPAGVGRATLFDLVYQRQVPGSVL